jgi:hypothetical protein
MDVHGFASTAAGYLGDGIRAVAGHFAWGPMLQLSKLAVARSLSRIQNGELIIKHEGEIVGKFGQAAQGFPAVELEVLSDNFWVRLLLFADMVR